MARDFEQLIGDTRYWLRNRSRPSLSHNNFAKQFGVVRKQYELLDSPLQCIMGYELRSIIGNKCITGAVQVESMGRDSTASVTQMVWHEEVIGIRSLLTGSDEIQIASELPGIILDRVYDQIAVPLTRVIQIINQ